LSFPALGFETGTVTAVRPGSNPELGAFEVLTVTFAGQSDPREFAAGLLEHKLNASPSAGTGDTEKSPDQLLAEFGPGLIAKLETRLLAGTDIVRLADRWFPRALLASVNVGDLNLAEAVLDMAGGGPLPTDDLLKETNLPQNINPRLRAFSLHFALQEDARFDEVGPAGQVLWFLHRLEPPEVAYPPRRLDNAAPAHDDARLTPELQALAREIEDELSPTSEAWEAAAEVTLTLTFPHRRVGTLPLTPRLAQLFPTAYESPRIRCLLVDGDGGEKFPGWVVRAGAYVYGLDEWYTRHEFPVGGLLTVRQGEQPGEVIVKADKRRPAREWVRTAAPGPEGRLTFTMQKRAIAVNYDELMIVAADNLTAIDDVWLKSQKVPYDRLVADIFRELAKLNPQSAVHARTLYAAVNVVRRSPPGAVFAELLAHPYYAHVGDAYWRFDQSQWTD
jgi:hypothetical protein